MSIRLATYRDATSIKSLLEVLGYKSRVSLLVDQMDRLFTKDDHEVYVYEKAKDILAFASVHYLPQLAFDGHVMIISYFSVDPASNEAVVAQELECFLTQTARQKGCERIQVHCLESRKATHDFYLEHGYQEYPKYFSKRLMYGE